MHTTTHRKQTQANNQVPQIATTYGKPFRMPLISVFPLDYAALYIFKRQSHADISFTVSFVPLLPLQKRNCFYNIYGNFGAYFLRALIRLSNIQNTILHIGSYPLLRATFLCTSIFRHGAWV